MGALSLAFWVVVLAGNVAGMDHFPLASKLPNDTQVTLGVVLEERWIRQYSTVDEVEKAVLEGLAVANKDLKHGNIVIQDIMRVRRGEVEKAVLEAVDGNIVVNNITSNNTLPTNYGIDKTAVLSILNCTKTHLLAKKLWVHGTIHIAISDTGCRRPPYKTSLFAPIVMGGEAATQLFNDLRSADTLTWNSFIVLHDDSVGPSVTEAIHKILSRNATVAMLYMGNLAKLDARGKTDAIKKLLDGFPAHDLGNKFIIMMRKSVVKPFMQVADSMGMFLGESQWMFLVTDSHSMDMHMSPFIQMAKEGYNIAFVYNASDIRPRANCHISLLCLTKDLVAILGKGTQNTLLEEQPLFYELSVEEWDVLRPRDVERAATVVHNIKKLIMNNAICGRCSRWRLESVESKEYNRIKELDVGWWRPTTGLMLNDDLFPHVSGGFRGRTLAVASLHYPPWMTFVRDPTGNVVGYTGLIFALVDEIAKKLNFTYVVTPPIDGKWGIKENGQWNGMIKQVMNKEVMFGAASFAVALDRRDVVNFTDPFDIQPYTFMYRRPHRISRATLFIDPFYPLVWLGIGICTLITGPILWLVHRSSYYYKYYHMVTTFGLFRMGYCMQYCYGAMVQQGGNFLPESHSGRIMVTTWWLFVIIIVTTYVGSLVAFLTVPQIEWPINSVERLIRKGYEDGYTWGIVAGSIIETYLKNADEENYQELERTAIKHATVDDRVLNMIKHNDHVLVEWKSFLFTMMKLEYNRTKTCNYAMAREEFFYEKVALAFPQDSPWIKHFNVEIKKVLQAGLMEKWKQVFWPGDDECSTTSQGGLGVPEVITLEDMQGSLFILFAGFFFALLTLLAECLVYWTKQERETNLQIKLNPEGVTNLDKENLDRKLK